jgi:hypothetical protein
MITGAITLLAALALAAPALAVDSNTAVNQGYPCATQSPGMAGSCSKPASGVAGNQKTAQPVATGEGTLPFTGSQLGIFAAVGLALVGGGLLLRGTTRGRSEQ